MSLDIGASRCKWKYHLAGKKIAPPAETLLSPCRRHPERYTQNSKRSSSTGPLTSCTATEFTCEFLLGVIALGYSSGRLAG